MKKFTITIEEAGERLDKFVTAKITTNTRSQLQRLIKQEFVLINGKAVTPHYKLKEEDVVEILRDEPEIRSEKVITKEEDLPYVKVIDETDEYIIIDKPAGLTVHGTKYVKGFTLVDVLLKQFPYLVKVGDDPDRPAIVHRLDKEVSGLMVIPKNMDSFDNIKDQFQKRTIQKKYTGLVYGVIESDTEEEVRFPIRRSSQGKKMAALPETHRGEPNKDGKRAITRYTVLENLKNFTLLSIKIITGRTHQIRVHMTALSHPLVGDILYNTKRTRELNDKYNLGRVFLVASELGFKDLSGELKEYKIDLPENLKKFLKEAK